MVIVHIVHGTVFGGVASVVRNLVAEQEKMGLKTAIVSHDTHPELLQEWISSHGYGTKVYAVEAFRAKRPTIWGELSGKNLRRIRRDFPGEQIVCHFHNPLTVGLFTPLKGAMVCTLHTLLNSSNKLRNGLFLGTLKRFMLHGGRPVGVSRFVSDYYAEKLGKKSLDHVLNGVEDLAREESRHVENNGRFHIGAVGYMDDLKGWRYLADAFVSLPGEIREKADLYFAGAVDPADRAYLEKLLKENKDIHHLGYIHDARTAFIPYLDVLVLASRSEAQGMVLLEAFQGRTAAMGTASGGIPEVVKDGENGFIITRDSADIAEKLRRLIENPELCRRMGENGRRFFEESGSSAHMARKYMELYEELLDK